jgi:hypothetical protein
MCPNLTPNLALDMVSQTKHNPLTHELVQFSLTYPNLEYGQSDRTEVHQPMD